MGQKSMIAAARYPNQGCTQVKAGPKRHRFVTPSLTAQLNGTVLGSCAMAIAEMRKKNKKEAELKETNVRTQFGNKHHRCKVGWKWKPITQ